MFQDLRYTVRTLLRRKGFTAVVVLTLALGIGANTAVFSMLRGVVLEPLPYEDPDELVFLWATESAAGSESREGGSGEGESKTRRQVAPADFFAWREGAAAAFEELAAFMFWSFNLSAEGEPEALMTAVVTPELFPLLAVEAIHGRTFTDEEAVLGAGNVVLLGHRLWQRRFGGAPEIVGQDIRLDEDTHTVVGVLPPGFHFPHDEVEIWVPMAFDPHGLGFTRSTLTVLGRLADGVSREQAQQRMDAVALRQQEQRAAGGGLEGADVMPMRQQVLGRYRPVLVSLFAAVAAVLLIACANVGNLLLARAMTRQGEIALRKALGAGLLGLFRQPLVESLLLAVVGGVVGGLLVGALGIRLFTLWSPVDVPRLAEVGLDPQVLFFTLGVSLAAGVVFSLLPFLQLVSVPSRSLLAEGSTARRQSWLANTFIVGQVALALFLLAATGLLLRSMIRLQQVPAGFVSEDLLVSRLKLPPLKYQGGQIANFYDDLLERLEAAAGTRSAAVVNILPVAVTGGAFSAPFTVQGRPLPANAAEPEAHVRIASVGYFRTLGIPLVTGRDFTADDRLGKPRVVIVNRTLAERFWPGAGALGERLRVTFQGKRTYEVVGVVGDVRHYHADRPPEPEIYFPLRQQPYGALAVAARTTDDPGTFTGALEQAVWSLDENVPVAEVTTMEERVAASGASERLHLTLLGSFALCALLLAALGIHGVVSQSVARRRREIGLRMALGARRGDVLSFVLGQVLRLTVLGLVLGAGALLAVALAFGPWLSRFLRQTSPADPLALAAAAAILLLVALFGGLVPAWRATRIDPMIALRYQ